MHSTEFKDKNVFHFQILRFFRKQSGSIISKLFFIVWSTCFACKEKQVYHYLTDPAWAILSKLCKKIVNTLHSDKVNKTLNKLDMTILYYGVILRFHKSLYFFVKSSSRILILLTIEPSEVKWIQMEVKK